MALIKCPDCENQVSDAATACPECGAPIKFTTGQRPPHQPVRALVELTHKDLKFHIVVSKLIIIAAIVWLLIAFNNTPPGGEVGAGMPVLLALVGFVYYSVTKLRIWWQHE